MSGIVYTFETTPEQMLQNSFARNVSTLIEKGYNIRTTQDGYNNMIEEFGTYQKLMSEIMLSNDGLDEHKIAAAASAAILCSKPLVIIVNKQRYLSSEIVGAVAFYVGMDILIQYQISRDSTDRKFNKSIFAGIKEIFPFSGNLKDTLDMPGGLVHAFSSLVEDGSNDKLPAWVWVLSHMFYFLDMHSKDVIKKSVLGKVAANKQSHTPPLPEGSYQPV